MVEPAADRALPSRDVSLPECSGAWSSPKHCHDTTRCSIRWWDSLDLLSAMLNNELQALARLHLPKRIAALHELLLKPGISLCHPGCLFPLCQGSGSCGKLCPPLLRRLLQRHTGDICLKQCMHLVSWALRRVQKSKWTGLTTIAGTA